MKIRIIETTDESISYCIESDGEMLVEDGEILLEDTITISELLRYYDLKNQIRQSWLNDFLKSLEKK